MHDCILYTFSSYQSVQNIRRMYKTLVVQQTVEKMHNIYIFARNTILLFYFEQHFFFLYSSLQFFLCNCQVNGYLKNFDIKFNQKLFFELVNVLLYKIYFIIFFFGSIKITMVLIFFHYVKKLHIQKLTTKTQKRHYLARFCLIGLFYLSNQYIKKHYYGLFLVRKYKLQYLIICLFMKNINPDSFIIKFYFFVIQLYIHFLALMQQQKYQKFF
eukprot:TRINITY_DN871_c0_g1_i4.p3 TRINITY_DN871_c0_g1~~TRINITY_DN871_c0_g1_i4.p3  ORF type:complete len:214 (+),score=-6.76 TRINITY_DN871_c0_g1_i4:937-1578(+)